MIWRYAIPLALLVSAAAIVYSSVATSRPREPTVYVCVVRAHVAQVSCTRGWPR